MGSYLGGRELGGCGLAAVKLTEIWCARALERGAVDQPGPASRLGRISSVFGHGEPLPVHRAQPFG
jgi:hypothetical protein